MASRGVVVCAVILVACGACGRIGFPNGGSDDTSRDSGAGDAASGDSGPLVDCTMTYPATRLCSGFEQSGMGEWDYDITTEGTTDLSTTRAYRGTHSLEIQTTAVDAYKEARWGKNYVLDAVMTGDIYVRAYYWLDASTVVTDQLSILIVTSGVDPYPSANVLLVPGEMHSNIDGESATAPFEFPRDRWVCLRMHLVVAATGGSIDIAVDGATVLSKANIDTRVANGYTNVDVGVHYATPAQTASRMWIDEVVIDTSPIACD